MVLEQTPPLGATRSPHKSLARVLRFRPQGNQELRSSILATEFDEVTSKKSVNNIPTRITVRRSNSHAKSRPRFPTSKVINTNSEKVYSPLPTMFISNSRSLPNKIDELTNTVSIFSVDIVLILRLGFPTMFPVQPLTFLVTL